MNDFIFISCPGSLMNSLTLDCGCIFFDTSIILGRFPCCFEFCGSYGGASYIFLSEQRLGYQYPYFRPVSKYSSFSCALFYLKIPFTVFLNGYINLFVVLFHWQVTVLLLKALLMEFEVFEQMVMILQPFILQFMPHVKWQLVKTDQS